MLLVLYNKKPVKIKIYKDITLKCCYRPILRDGLGGCHKEISFQGCFNSSKGVRLFSSAGRSFYSWGDVWWKLWSLHVVRVLGTTSSPREVGLGHLMAVGIYLHQYT